MEAPQITDFLVNLFLAAPGWFQIVVIVSGTATLALIAGAGIFLRSYFTQTGVLRAQKDSIDSIKDVVTATSQAVKTIEAEIEFRSWHARDDNALRRAKLEALLLAAEEHYEWANFHRDACLFSLDTPPAASKRALFVTNLLLHFPELSEVGGRFLEKVSLATIENLLIRNKRIERFQALSGEEQARWLPDWNARVRPTPEETTHARDVQLGAYGALVDLEKQCPRLMKALRPTPIVPASDP